MARAEARIRTNIWQNPGFRELGAFEQWVYFLALSQPTMSLCGVVSYTPRRWAGRAAGVTVEMIRSAVASLAAKDYIVVDEDTEEVWVRTFVRYDGVLNSANSLVGMSRDFPSIQSKALRDRFLDGLIEGFPEGFPKGLPQGVQEGLRDRLDEGLMEPLRARARAGVSAHTRGVSASASFSASTPSEPGTPSLTPSDSVGAVAAPGGGRKREEVLQAAWCRMAKSEMRAEQDRGASIRSESGFMRKKESDFADQYGEKARKLLEDDPLLNESELVGILTSPSYANAYRNTRASAS